jgi:hypothetical protein
MGKTMESFVWLARIIIGIIVALIIGNGLKGNPRFTDPFVPWLLGIFAGFMFIFVLYIITKKD